MFMVSCLEIDIGQAGQGLVKECLNVVGGTKRRYGTRLAVTEQFREIILAGEVQIPLWTLRGDDPSAPRACESCRRRCKSRH